MAHFDEVTKIWHGPKVIKSPRPFTTKLFEHLQKTPNKIAQISVYERTELTYNDLRLMSIRAAQNLIEIGVKPGDVVGIIARNSTFVAPVVFGCFLIGAPINSLDVSHKTEDIKHMWGITRPKLVFSDPEKVPLVQEAIKELKLNAKIFTFLENVKGCVSVSEILIKTGKEEVFKPKEFPLDSIVAVLCSSGTTGASKGIVCTQAHFNTTLKIW